jgi:hypothetical protein
MLFIIFFINQLKKILSPAGTSEESSADFAFYQFNDDLKIHLLDIIEYITDN